MAQKKIIGIAGQARMGKDTIGNLFVSNEEDWILCSFSHALKNHVCSLLQIDLKTLEEWKVKEEFFPKCNMNMRKILQHVGDSMREINKYIWIDYLMNTNSNTNIIITDVRYENEINYLKEKGAFLILVGRSECLNNDQAESERFIRGPIEHMLTYSSSFIEIDSDVTHNIASKFDVFIKNDSNIQSLREAVSNLKIIANRKWMNLPMKN